MEYALRWLVLALGASLWIAAAHPGAVTLSEARAIDGDTFEGRHAALAHPVRVRLLGIDAPERGEPGYAEARSSLARLLEGRAVRCIDEGARSFERWVMRCEVGGADLGAALIAAGHAQARP